MDLDSVLEMNYLSRSCFEQWRSPAPGQMQKAPMCGCSLSRAISLSVFKLPELLCFPASYLCSWNALPPAPSPSVSLSMVKALLKRHLFQGTSLGCPLSCYVCSLLASQSSLELPLLLSCILSMCLLLLSVFYFYSYHSHCFSCCLEQLGIL